MLVATEIVNNTEVVVVEVEVGKDIDRHHKEVVVRVVSTGGGVDSKGGWAQGFDSTETGL